MSLRKEVIRLAHSKPELREHLLPLVTDKIAMSGKNVLADMVLDLMFEYQGKSIRSSGSVMYIDFKSTKELNSISAELDLKTHELTIHATSANASARDVILQGKSNALVLNLLKMSKSGASKRIQRYLKSI